MTIVGPIARLTWAAITHGAVEWTAAALVIYYGYSGLLGG